MVRQNKLDCLSIVCFEMSQSVIFKFKTKPKIIRKHERSSLFIRSLNDEEKRLLNIDIMNRT
jgi:hypothetical protein